MHCNIKRGTAIVLTAALATVLALPASQTDAQASEGNYKVKETYLALGADLTDSEKATVYELLGVEEGEIPEDQIQTVTNSEEHEYLDSYIPTEQIGDRALSSVLVTKASDGDGIDVTTKNIGYCTEGMYENALATAGAKDIDVVVAGPFEISGTAALVGAIKAYSEKTGDEIDEETVDAAIDEMITTGDIKESVKEAAENGDISDEEIEGMVAWLKEQVASRSDEDLDALIDEGEEKFDISLTDSEQSELRELLRKLSALDLDVKSLKQQAQNIYNTLDGMGIDISDISKEDASGILNQILAFLRGILNK